MTMSDFASYKVKEQEPLYGFYHGKKVVTAPLPASGPVLISILNILEGFIDSSFTSYINIHRMLESFKFGYAQRTFVKT
jgi:gamma-glutamyltranspeptidase